MHNRPGQQYHHRAIGFIELFQKIGKPDPHFIGRGILQFGDIKALVAKCLGGDVHTVRAKEGLNGVILAIANHQRVASGLCHTGRRQ